MSTEVNSSILNLNNVFHTLQGEGANAGRRSLFVRMPYCNLACSWCDTTFNTFEKWPLEKFQAFAKSEKCRFAVITGGEPTMNKHTPKVIAALKDLGFEIAIETNGCFPIPEGIDFVTCSPKRDAKYEVNQLVWKKVNEFKYVIDEGFQWDVLNRHQTNDGKRYSLSPEFSRWKQSIAEIMEYIKDHPSWRLSMQTHKILDIP